MSLICHGLDASYLYGRLGKTLQVCPRAVVVAMGVNADGGRELLGLKVGDSESEPFWWEFLASLKQRGHGGVRLVISVGEAFPGGVAHVGLTKAVSRMFQGCSWQRCRMHFARNLLQTVPKAQQEMVAATLRSVFTQQSAAAMEEQGDEVASMLSAKFSRAAELMAAAREGVLAFRHFPLSHWRKLWNTNLLERVDEEIKTRTRVVGIFPNDPRDHTPGGRGAAGAGRALAAGRTAHVLARLDGRHPAQR